MPGTVWPSDGPRTRASHAEVAVYEALRRQLPNDWTAWHSLRLRKGGDYEGEGDFVIAAPEIGLLVLEVKGGAIELRGGRWLQNGHRLDRAPLDQARAFAGRLADALRERCGAAPPFGTACIFPDIEFFEPPSEGGMIGSVLGGRDLQWLGDALRETAARVIPKRPLPRTASWIDALSKLWGVTWAPRLRLTDAAADAARRAVELDREQLALLDFAGETSRALVAGAAGSGKTSVARELCARRAERGERVLYLCFTEALALAVDRTLQPLRDGGSDARARTVRRYASELLQAKGEAVPDASSQADWEEVSLRAALTTLPPADARPSLVIVDEAQDLAENDWHFVQELVADGGLWAFHDPHQRFWSDRSLPSALFEDVARLTLKRQHRNPRAIEWLAAQYAGTAGGTATTASGEVPATKELSALRLVVTEPSKLLDRVRHELDELIREGASPSEIAVISLRGQTRSMLAQQTRFGSHEAARADAADAHERIVADTFLRLKGLDRSFVVVAEIDPTTSAGQDDTRMHIALTRATVRCYVLCGKDVIDADPRLATLQQLLAASG